ncbi:MAG: hypothetical protein ACD_79C01235G0002 [uncultured bacterium]|nr:MAG: hypothetical protein ACD_79C01235G0002 [uncultured bacterium]
MIVGLGNPGLKYEKTRHNFGFMVLDELARLYSCSFSLKKSFEGFCSQGLIENHKVILLKPQTFMNLSGSSVQKTSGYFNIPPDNILVVHDDLDIDFGKIRTRNQGSNGGHNGIKSVHNSLQTENFKRVKLGISNEYFKNLISDRARKEKGIVDFVLSGFEESEKNRLNSLLSLGVKAIIDSIKNSRPCTYSLQEEPRFEE